MITVFCAVLAVIGATWFATIAFQVLLAIWNWWEGEPPGTTFGHPLPDDPET